MIDVEFIKRKIYKPNEEELKIAPGDEIPLEVINILKDGHYKDREMCFSQGDPKNPCTVHLNCTRCNTEITAMLSKTSILNYLKGSKEVLCNDCLYKEKEEAKIIALKEQEMRKSENEKRQERYNSNAQQVIDKYINTTITSTLSREQLTNIFKDINRTDYNNDMVATAIKVLAYKDFLQTPYWKAVSYQAKQKAKFCCHVCSSKQNLATHHRTYRLHGYEHTYDGMRELIVLCKACHEKFHDKLSTL